MGFWRTTGPKSFYPRKKKKRQKFRPLCLFLFAYGLLVLELSNFYFSDMVTGP